MSWLTKVRRATTKFLEYILDTLVNSFVATYNEAKIQLERPYLALLRLACFRALNDR
jgi:hypothetical protein